MQNKKTLKLWFNQYKKGADSDAFAKDESATKLEKLKQLFEVSANVCKSLYALGDEFVFFAEKAQSLQASIFADIQKTANGLCSEVNISDNFELKEHEKKKYFKLLDKFKTGDPTSDSELKDGIEFFGKLYKNLDTMGEEYSLAASYLFKVEYTFSGYQRARSRN